MTLLFIQSILKARAKMAGILNKVFFKYEIVTLNHSTVGLVFGKLGLYAAHTEFLIVEAAGACQIWGSCHILTEGLIYIGEFLSIITLIFCTG